MILSKTFCKVSLDRCMSCYIHVKLFVCLAHLLLWFRSYPCRRQHCKTFKPFHRKHRESNSIFSTSFSRGQGRKIHSPTLLTGRWQRCGASRNVGETDGSLIVGSSDGLTVGVKVGSDVVGAMVGVDAVGVHVGVNVGPDVVGAMVGVAVVGVQVG